MARRQRHRRSGPWSGKEHESTVSGLTRHVVRHDQEAPAPKTAEGALPGPAFAWPLTIAAVALGGVVLGIASYRHDLAKAGIGLAQALWVLPGLVCLHLGQLALAGAAWRSLFAQSRPGIATFYRLRIIREGIDSLLPVAQVGGEIVGARLLSRYDVAPSRAAASVIVDVTIELLTQVIFLMMGLCALAWLSRSAGAGWRVSGAWAEVLLGGAAATTAFVLAQRFGMLRVLETLLRGMARRWPALAGASLEGLHAAALDFYRQPAALLLRGTGLHLLAWALGSIETWATLHALGVPATPLQAFTVESLGMAARSAGFAIPAALGAQEGGFMLAAAAVGLPVAPALSLSLIKRVREILVGLVGLALWQATGRSAPV